jgi:hypothetical protein
LQSTTKTKEETVAMAIQKKDQFISNAINALLPKEAAEQRRKSRRATMQEIINSISK